MSMNGFKPSMSLSLSCSKNPPAINLPNGQLRVFGSFSFTRTQCYKPKSISAFPSTSIKQSSLTTFPFVSKTSMFNSPLYSFPSNYKTKDLNVSVSSGGIGIVESDWLHKFRDAWQSAVGTIASNKVILCILTSTVFPYLILPRLLRGCYKYTMHDPSLPSPNLFRMQVPYEKSLWEALEDPLRYLVIFMTFTKIGTMMTAQNLAQIRRVAFIFSFMFFLQRWKTNLFSYALSCFGEHEQQKILTLDRVASVCLFVVGIMGSALACGVAVYTTLIVGGIGGVSIAFASREFLENVCSGLSMQFSKPFSLGDAIKVGSIEGQVVEMGLAATWLLSDEALHIMVPNSMFASQATLNKSRTPFHTMSVKIPIQVDGMEKIPRISNDIEDMLRSNPKVFLGKEPPCCFLSQTENSSAELTLRCNLKNTNNREMHSTESNIRLQLLLILKDHGVLSKVGCQDLIV